MINITNQWLYYIPECIEEGTSYPGGLIKVVDKISTMLDCKKECGKTTTCVAFTYYSQKCLLKNDKHGSANKKNWMATKAKAVSALMSCFED